MDSEKVVVVGRLSIGRTGAAVALVVGVGAAAWLGASALPGFKSAKAAAPAAAAASAVAPAATPAAPPASSAAPASPAAVKPAQAARAVQGPTPIFVLNSLDASISVIDPLGWKEQSRIPTGKEPHHLYLTPDERSLVVANALGDSLTLVDPRTGAVQRVIRDIVDPYHLRFSPDMKWFVTAANRLNHIDFYRWDAATQTPTLVKRVSTGKTPSHLFIDAQSKTLYSTMQDSDALVAIDIATQTIKARVPTGPMPADVYGSPDGKKLFVGLTGGDGVEVFDITGAEPRSLGQIKTAAGAHAFRAAGDDRHLYVSNRVANTISKIDMVSSQVVANYPAPGGPDCMDVSADGRYIFVASRWARKLSVIDTVEKKVVNQVNVGKSPHGVWTLSHAAR
ncbi:YncE family protein [Comamonas sp. AG1104]|uniref:YncE family protein n=1 Tax=Comamonas sp. AG1104 TaxID=2183900 RepID=UPI000E0A9C63|nr:YncE family protein [Comamonas sp. AG1104]RDI09596.1 YVTN family beta-propeller protein [Comamonas sp. AG1104]